MKQPSSDSAHTAEPRQWAEQILVELRRAQQQVAQLERDNQQLRETLELAIRMLTK